MKKTLTVLASAVLALGMLFVMGCKQPTLGDIEDTKDWKKPEKITDELKMLHIKADNADIDWYAVTKTNGEVIKTGNVTKNTEATITFDSINNNTDVVVWINQDLAGEFKGKPFEKGTKTFRGTVKIYKDKGVRILASNWSEAIQPVGTVTVTCDEPNNKSKWHGNYKITELLPLRVLPDNKFMVEGGLQYNNFEITEKGGSKEFIWPAGAFRLAIYQPTRFDSDAAYKKGLETSEDEAKNLKDLEEKARIKQVGWYWSKDVKIARSGKATINSSSCDKAFDKNGIDKNAKPDDEQDGRSVVVPGIILDESDFIYAPNEK